jgi:hypothetical protein
MRHTLLVVTAMWYTLRNNNDRCTISCDPMVCKNVKNIVFLPKKVDLEGAGEVGGGGGVASARLLTCLYVFES